MPRSWRFIGSDIRPRSGRAGARIAFDIAVDEAGLPQFERGTGRGQMKVPATELPEDRCRVRLMVGTDLVGRNEFIEERVMCGAPGERRSGRAVPGEDVTGDVETRIAEQRGCRSVNTREICHGVEGEAAARDGFANIKW